MTESELKKYLSTLQWQKAILLDNVHDGSDIILFLLGSVESSIKSVQRLITDFTNNIIDED